MKPSTMTAPLILAAIFFPLAMAAAQEPADLVPPTQSPTVNPAAAVTPRNPWPMSIPSIWAQEQGARQADALTAAERRALRERDTQRPSVAAAPATVPGR